MLLFRKLLIFVFVLMGFVCNAQRQYAANSVLGNGNWYKIGVPGEGIYKIDLAFLSSLGINTSNISSASIRLFGNGGSMLPENNLTPRLDDLVENALQVVDGGDGILNGEDYFIFYAPGPNQWVKDSVNQRFRHVKNIYSDQSFYFLSIGGVGKRIQTSFTNQTPNVTVTSYDYRYFHETDTINFLKSGREWFGEEFSNTPGNTTTRLFNMDVPGFLAATPVTINTNAVARSVGAGSRFDIKINDQNLPALVIPAVSGNFLEAFAAQAEQLSSARLATLPNKLALTYTYLPGSFNSQAWLNWFEVHARANLSMVGTDQLTFRDWGSVNGGNTGKFLLEDVLPATRVWEITDQINPRQMGGTLTQTEFSFTNDASRLREYIAFNGNAFLKPVPLGMVTNQNLHNSGVADFLIITHASLNTEAQRLTQFHRQNNLLKVVVVTTAQVFNEFASGSPDATAVRDFVKMYYDRAGTDTAKRPKYLLLFGDASFDYKSRINNNTNLVPCYESSQSVEPLNTYTADDYFGYLDDADDINLVSPPSLLDIGIGRIPASTSAQAKIMVDKIIHYNSPASLGPWRNQTTYVADDEDANLHLQDAEFVSSNAFATNPFLNQNKIYLDAYRQESGSGGSRYPAANQAIINQMFNGNLIWNYSGHGGSQRLADEAILDADVIKQFNNADKLPLFVTATCDFAPYDDPTVVSIGDNLLMADAKGAIALTTTTRLVFAYSNRVINNNFLTVALKAQPNGEYLPLGEALKRAKNITSGASGDIINNRKFTLLGDPAMKLALPEWKARINTINGQNAVGNDTLKALDKYTITGDITDASGTPLSNFNGSVYPTIFDKAQTVQTLANDAGSNVTGFTQRSNAIYKGKASVANGKFSFTFIVPKDINYLVGTGRISLYAENGTKDANGLFTDFKIGGAGTGSLDDKEGPSIKTFLNDEKFVNGGLVNENPVLILQLADSSGINTAGSGIGHDITVLIDGNEKNILVLNDFYEASLNSYQKGTVRFQLPVLDDGVHNLKIKAWDVANNSTEVIIEFVTAKKEELQLSHVLNYPNPFTTKTNFWFEHNQPSSNLTVLIQIYSVSGKLVHQIKRIISTNGNRSSEIEWDGKDAYSEKVGRGVYIYTLSVTAPGGKRVVKTEKLYLL